MNSRRLCPILLFLWLGGVVSCATLNTPAGNTRLYLTNDLEHVANVTAESLAEVGLTLEEQRWATPGVRYVIKAYDRQRLSNETEGIIRVAEILIYIDRVEDGTTRVTINATTQERNPMARSADNRVDYAQPIFSRIDTKVPPSG